MVLFIAASLPLGNIQILVENILKLLSLGINWEGGSCFPGCSVRLPGLLQCWLLPSVPEVSEVVRKKHYFTSTFSDHNCGVLGLPVIHGLDHFCQWLPWSPSDGPSLVSWCTSHSCCSQNLEHLFSDTFSCCCSLLSPSLSPPRSGPIT